MFAFDVPFKGSVPPLNLRSYAGAAAMAATSSGRGYYVLAADGGIFTFGDAKFHGSAAGLPASAQAVAMTVMATPPGT